MAAQSMECLISIGSYDQRFLNEHTENSIKFYTDLNFMINSIFKYDGKTFTEFTSKDCVGGN